MMFIQLLSFLISLEKHHKAIIAVQRWMLDVGLTEKNSRAGESNSKNQIYNISTYCSGIISCIMHVFFILYQTLTFLFYSDIIVFCNGPLQSINFMELKFQKQKALIESKQKLVDALEEIHLNQRYIKNRISKT